LYHKFEKDKSSGNIELIDKVFDVGNVSFELLLDSKRSEVDVRIFKSDEGYLSFHFS